MGSESLEQQLHRRQIQEQSTTGQQVLVLLGQPPIARPPRQRALHDPPPREQDKALASGGRVTISKSSPNVSRSQVTRSPRYPRSAHTLSKRGKCGRSCWSNARPPSCSDQSA